MAVFRAWLFISLCLLGFAGAVFEDQVGKFDWYVHVVNTWVFLVPLSSYCVFLETV